MDDVIFVQSSDDEVKALHSLENGDIVLIRHFDEPIVKHTGEISKDAIKDFVSANQMPTVIEFDQKAAEHIFGG